MEARAANIFDLPDEAWFDLDFMHKDIDLALATADELNIPLPTEARTGEILTLAYALGYGGRDIAALFELLEQMMDERAKAA
jgi:3-hydroxyisobutyrate dehydrogenase-like beta-hydroxyacid dehydrogenase